MAESALIKAVADLGQCQAERLDSGYICRVTLVNGCPPDWKVHIIAGGTDFFYRDGTNFQDGPVAMNITSGGSFTFSSNDATKCVERTLTVLTAQVEGQPPQNLSSQSNPIPPNQCMEQLTVTLGPKTFSQDSIGSKRNPALELRSH